VFLPVYETEVEGGPEKKTAKGKQCLDSSLSFLKPTKYLHSNK